MEDRQKPVVKPRQRRRFVIESSGSSGSEDEDDEVVLVVSPVGSPVARAAQDGGFLSDDSSLEGYLQALRITDEKDTKSPSTTTCSRTQHGDDDDDDDSSSSPRNKPKADEEEEEEEEDHDHAGRRGLDLELELSIDENSAWSYDTKRKVVFLSSSENASAAAAVWPAMRLPVPIFTRLFDYQKVAVQWMASLHSKNIGGILGDSMGMGKTFMTLSFLGGLFRAGTIRNALIVAPVSVLRSWEQEANHILRKCVQSSSPRRCVDVAAAVQIQVVSSDVGQQQRNRMIANAMKCSSKQPHVIIASYGLLTSATAQFTSNDDDDDDSAACCWDYVVLDEGHQIKNQNAQRSRACRTVCSNTHTRRLLLTGTPILNNLTELWALFDWATSGKVLGNLHNFKKRFAQPIESARDKNASESVIKLGQRVNAELQGILKPYFLQRLKIDFLRDKLPPKREVVVWTHLSQEQRQMYTDFVHSGNSIVKYILRGDIGSPLEAITFLKKLCGHPLLAKKKDETNTEEDGSPTANATTTLRDMLMDLDAEYIIQQSPKLRVLVDIVRKFRDDGHQTLIFSQSTKMLDIIQAVLYDVELLRIDGSTKERDRQAIVDSFNSNARDKAGLYDAMLLSTKAAGLGLTLTGANRVIVYDPSWTPAEDDQAVDRAFRIGQDREVLVYRLITAGTVEEKMYEKQVHKDGIRRTVFTEGTTVDRYFNQHELKQLFTLAPVGVCELVDKFRKEGRAILTDPRRHEFVLHHDSVVGLTKHDGIYTTASSIGNGKVVGADASKNATMQGRARRVLANEDVEIVPLKTQAAAASDEKRTLEKKQQVIEQYMEKRSSAPAACDDSSNSEKKEQVIDLCQEEEEEDSEVAGDDTSSSAKSNERIIDLYTTEEKESSEPVEVLLSRSITLRTNGKLRRSLKVLTKVLGNHYDCLNKNEKMYLHKQIAEVAGSLGLL